MVIWIIGLSGSGKTTLGEAVVEKVRASGRKVIFLDGDKIRDLFGNDLSHDLQGRERNAKRICNICHYLDAQGIDVVCAILSIFENSRQWCRNNMTSYFEVFIDAPLQQLIERDSKGLYAQYERGEISDVAGLDLNFAQPQSPDLLIENNSTLDNLIKYTDRISERILRDS